MGWVKDLHSKPLIYYMPSRDDLGGRSMSQRVDTPMYPIGSGIEVLESLSLFEP